MLKAHGVEHIFTLSGGHISPILTGSEKLGIKIIDTRHEANAVFAADAQARLKGIPGVAVVTAGPGVTNTITALKNAQMAESPVVVFGGAPATLLKGKGALQDIDQMSLMKSLTKWHTTINKVRDIIPSVREAFRQAQAGTPGPVFIECPLDILYPYSLIRKEAMAVNTKTLKGKAIHWYLDHYTRNLFAGAFDVNQEVNSWPVEIPFAKFSQILKAIEIISKAKKPLILLGSQAILPPVGAERLRECVESLGIPCYLGGMSRGLLGKTSSIQMRQARRDALKEADVVILGGIVCDFRLNYGKALSPKSKIIAVNRNKSQLTKNEGVFWKSTLSLRTDVGNFFMDLKEHLGNGQYKVDSDWIASLRAREEAKEKSITEMAKEPATQHLNPIKILCELESILPKQTILVADGGDFVASAAYILKPPGPLTWLDPGAFGTLGCGGGFAMGAKLTYPNSDVVIIYGDGSLGYTLMEFDSFVRHKIPVLAIVGNDACWTQIAREQVPMLGSSVSCDLAYTNYEKAVEALGGKGFLVDRENESQFKEIVLKGLELTRNGTPVLINVLLGKTNFRKGSISV